MKILALETSCDETAAAVLDGTRLRANVIASQDIHIVYGGVVPELASRAHMQKVSQVVRRALDEAGTTLAEIDAFAVTCGPGLAGSLLVGLSFAKGLALSQRKPLIGINHLEGHLFSATLEHPHLEPPFLALIVSGGHTLLVLVHDVARYEILGQTIDDAAGEAFDKVAKILGLPYPGGPSVQKAAEQGDPLAESFPVAKIKGRPYDFSFSGLKTAVLYRWRALAESAQEQSLADIAASFQHAVIQALVPKISRAVKKHGLGSVVIAGGVARNSALRAAVLEAGQRDGFEAYIPAGEFCTDNAAMIAQVAALRLARGEQSDFSLVARPQMDLAGERARK